MYMYIYICNIKAFRDKNERRWQKSFFLSGPNKDKIYDHVIICYHHMYPVDFSFLSENES